jgi:hypothetical protein
MWSLRLRFFLQTISIVKYKILRLEVEKHHFILIIAHMSISTYFRPNIHQNGPEILGVKLPAKASDYDITRNGPGISKGRPLLKYLQKHRMAM